MTISADKRQQLIDNLQKVRPQIDKLPHKIVHLENHLMLAGGARLAVAASSSSSSEEPAIHSGVLRSLMSTFLDVYYEDAEQDETKVNEAKIKRQIKDGADYKMAVQALHNSANQEETLKALKLLIRKRKLTEDNIAFIYEFKCPANIALILVRLDYMGRNDETHRNILRQRYLETPDNVANGIHVTSLQDALNFDDKDCILRNSSEHERLFYFRMLVNSPFPYYLHGGVLWLNREGLLCEQYTKHLATHLRPFGFAKALITLHKAGIAEPVQIDQLLALEPKKMKDIGDLLYDIHPVLASAKNNRALFAMIVNHPHPAVLKSFIDRLMQRPNCLLKGERAVDCLDLVSSHANLKRVFELFQKLSPTSSYNLFSNPDTSDQNFISLMQASPDELYRIEEAFDKYPPDRSGGVRFASIFGITGEPRDAQECLNYALHPERKPLDLTKPADNIIADLVGQLPQHMLNDKIAKYITSVTDLHHKYRFGGANQHRLFRHAFSARPLVGENYNISYLSDGVERTLNMNAHLTGDRYKRFLLNQIEAEIQTILRGATTNYVGAYANLTAFQMAVNNSDIGSKIRKAQGLYTSALQRLGFHAKTDSQNALDGLFIEAFQLLNENINSLQRYNRSGEN